LSFLTKQHCQLLQVDRVGVKLSTPASTTIGVKGNADNGDSGAGALPHTGNQLRDAGDPEDPEAFACPGGASEQRLQISSDPDIWLHTMPP
jgi:hypothetical protein